MSELTIQSAKVQEMQAMTGINLMLELESINDKIPLNTPFELNGLSVPCLRMAINDAIINYADNYSAPETVFNLKTIYETLTGYKIEITDLQGNSKAELITALNEIIENVPTSLPATIDNENYPCFKTVVSMVLEGWLNSNSKYFQDRIREIFHIIHLNGFTQFQNKY